MINFDTPMINFDIVPRWLTLMINYSTPMINFDKL